MEIGLIQEYTIFIQHFHLFYAEQDIVKLDLKRVNLVVIKQMEIPLDIVVYVQC